MPISPNFFGARMFIVSLNVYRLKPSVLRRDDFGLCLIIASFIKIS